MMPRSGWARCTVTACVSSMNSSKRWRHSPQGMQGTSELPITSSSRTLPPATIICEIAEGSAHQPEG